MDEKKQEEKDVADGILDPFSAFVNDDDSKRNWIASGVGGKKENMEKVLYGQEMNDRRKRIISGNDDRFIMQ